MVNIAPDLSKATVQVGNRFKLDWVRAQYSQPHCRLLEKLYGQPIQVELALTPLANQLPGLSLRQFVTRDGGF